ncbi:MAG: GntG family PLP-dependent aldolase [Balneolaceae bacterium]|nr:GntG family PLP-dependent aldolase [Balneolaceae bacterium]
MIDLRSDTVTSPTTGMLKAMTDANVGDDVFGEDPTVNAFQEKIAAMFGMEAGLFVPSGVMSNQLALKVLTNPGEEVIIDHKGHIFNYETSAASLISGVQIHPVEGTKGKLNPDLIQSAMRGGNDWEPLPSVVVVENTTNKGGGTCYSKEELARIKQKADELDLGLHLDGARIWNAIVATGIDPDFFGTVADTITVSFSKGLGAPVGSMLLSSNKNITKARRFRKMLGGGMRQVGILAAAADYAVENHFSLLKEDHRRAKELAHAINECEGLTIDLESVESNIIIFKVDNGEVDSALTQLEDQGVRMVPFGSGNIRATMHFQVTDADLKIAQKAIKHIFG